MRELTNVEKNHVLFKSLLNFGYPDKRFRNNKLFLDLCGSTTDFIKIHFHAYRVCDEHRNMLKSRRKLSPQFKQAYDDLLNNWVNLFNELDVTEPLEIAQLFSILLWNGYFSINKNLYYQYDDRANLTGWYSLDIMTGRGVCLNFSDMLKDLLLKMSVDAALLINYMDKVQRQNITSELVKRKYVQESKRHKIVMKLISPILRKFGNHAFVVIREQERLFAFDPTNLVCAHIKNLKSAQMIDGKGIFQLQVEDSYAYAKTNAEYYALDGIFETNHTYLPFTREEINDSWVNSYYKYKYNMDKVDMCYSDTLPAIKYISKKIKLLKRK